MQVYVKLAKKEKKMQVYVKLAKQINPSLISTCFQPVLSMMRNLKSKLRQKLVDSIKFYTNNT